MEHSNFSLIREEIKLHDFKLSTTEHDEDIALGESQPWNLVNRTIRESKLYLETTVPWFSSQTKEIVRYIDEPSDIDASAYFPVNSLEVNESITDISVRRIIPRSTSFKETSQSLINTTFIRRYRTTII